MRTVLAASVVVVTCGTVHLPHLASAQNLDDLRLTITPVRDTVPAGSPVVVEVRVANTGDAWVRATVPLDARTTALRIFLQDSDGKFWFVEDKSLDVLAYASLAFETRIPPNGFVGRTFILDERRSPGEPDQLPPGRYRLWGRLDVGAPWCAERTFHFLEVQPVEFVVR